MGGRGEGGQLDVEEDGDQGGGAGERGDAGWGGGALECIFGVIKLGGRVMNTGI